jgi:hypothetical protein
MAGFFMWCRVLTPALSWIHVLTAMHMQKHPAFILLNRTRPEKVGHEPHQPCDRQQQKPDTRHWIQRTPSVAPNLALAYCIASWRRAKTCALRLDGKLAVIASSDHTKLTTQVVQFNSGITHLDSCRKSIRRAVAWTVISK